MAEELKIVLAVDGADKVATALDNTSDALKETAAEAKKAGDALNKSVKPGAEKAGQALTSLTRVADDAPFGFIGISNNLQPLFDDFQRLSKESGGVGNALKVLVSSLSGPAGIGFAFAAVSSAITFAQVGLTYWSRKTQEAKESNDELKKSVDGIYSNVAKEGTQVVSLIAVLKSESDTRERKLAAIKELNKIAPDTFRNIKIEGDAVIGLDNAYKSWLENQKSVVAAKILQARLDKLITEQLKNQGKTDTGVAKAFGQSEEALKGRIAYQEKFIRDNKLEGNALIFATNTLNGYKKQLQETTKAGSNLTAEIEAIALQLQEVSQGIKVTTDNTEKGTKKTKKELESFDAVIKKTLDGLRDQEQIAIALDQSTIKEQIDIVKETISKAIKDYNLPSNDQRVIVLSAILSDLEATAAAEDAANKFKNNFDKAVKKGKLKITIPEIETVGINVADLEKKLTEILKQTLVNVGVTIGETLGNILTGAANFGDIFKGIFATLSEGVTAMGKQLIEIGVLALAAKISLGQLFMNPGASIAVGIALVALGTALRNLTTSKFAVGTNYAPGGMALVGERGPELVNLPRGSQVVPAAQTSAMLGGRNQVEVFGVLRGQDIYFSNKKYSQTYNRQT